MDDGLIQVLFIAVFVIVSLMDAAARKRRKQAQSLGHHAEPDGLAEAPSDLDQAVESSEGSEGTVPVDPWEEIAALARGEVPGQAVDPLPLSGPTTDEPGAGLEAWTAPQHEMPQMRSLGADGGGRAGRSAEMYDRPDVTSLTGARSADLQSGYLHPDQAASHEKHAHEKHVVAASPSHPVPAEPPHEFVPHSREQPSKPQKEARRDQQPGSLLEGFRGRARGSLREAIVLAEVLSPPVVLRDSGWKPLF